MSELGDKITKLFQSGYSYTQIKKELGCSMGSISYWCNPKEHKRARERAEKRRKENPLMGKLEKKVDHYVGRRNRIKGENEERRTKENRGWTVQDALNQIGGQYTKCYLTGIPINLEKDDYELDHLEPYSLNENYSLENMRVTIPKANRSKSDMSLSEYISLCKLVLINFGYEIKEPKDIKERIESA